MKKIFISLAVLLIVLIGYETVMSFSSGIGGRTRKNGYGEPEFGCSCHNVDSLNTVNVRIYGPSVVAPGFKYVYRVTIKGGPAIAGGFDMNCWYGTVDTVGGQQTQNFGFDITHTQPKPFNGADSISWLVHYTAKDTNVILFDTLYAAGNSVNQNGVADSVDRWNWSPNFVVKIDPATIGIHGSTETASEFSLSQNYPNPFNPVTNIKYSIPHSGRVTIKVFDVTGKEMAELVNKIQNAGSYNVEFNAANLPSGVYFYKMTIDGTETIEKKMVLVK